MSSQQSRSSGGWECFLGYVAGSLGVVKSVFAVCSRLWSARASAFVCFPLCLQAKTCSARRPYKVLAWFRTSTRYNRTSGRRPESFARLGPGQRNSFLFATCTARRQYGGFARRSRSPVGAGQRATMGSVGTWPMATVPARSLGAGLNRYPPTGVTGDGFPPPEGRMQQAGAAFGPFQHCGGPLFGKLSGGNRIVHGRLSASFACSAPGAGCLRRCAQAFPSL